jgi:hypothetical protein
MAILNATEIIFTREALWAALTLLLVHVISLGTYRCMYSVHCVAISLPRYSLTFDSVYKPFSQLPRTSAGW